MVARLRDEYPRLNSLTALEPPVPEKVSRLPEKILMLLGVHISDGVLDPAWWIGGFAVLALGLAASLRKLDERDIPRLGVLTAAFFVASQIHIPIGVISVHLLLNGLVGVILRRRAAIAIAVGLAMQALLFGHGGLTTIGINFCVLAIPAWLAGICFSRGASRWLGCTLGLVCAAITVILHVSVLYFGGKGDWTALALTSLVAHLPVIVLEGIGVGFAVKVLAKGKPEWLGLRPERIDQPPEGKISSNGISH